MEKSQIKNSCFAPARRGFTLLEVIISMGIFFVVVIIAIGAVLSINRAHIKASNLQAIQDNLRFTLEFITKEIRSGKSYAVISPTQISFTDSGGNFVSYCLLGEAIHRLTAIGACDASPPAPLTGDDIIVEQLKFLLIDTASEGGVDAVQPRMTIAIKARTKNPRLATSFNLETTVTQRQR